MENLWLIGVLLLWTDAITKASLISTTLNWGWLTVQRSSLLSSWQEARQHMGRHGAGEGPMRSKYASVGSRKSKPVGLNIEVLKPQSFLQLGHTSKSVSSSATPWCRSIQVYEPLQAILIQTTITSTFGLNIFQSLITARMDLPWWQPRRKTSLLARPWVYAMGPS